MGDFELLTLASEFPAPFRWQFEGLCRVEHAERSWERQITASWNDSGVGHLVDHDFAIWSFALGGWYGERRPTITVTASDASWNAGHVHPYTRNERDGTTELHWWNMFHRFSEADVAATTIFLTNPPSVIYPDHLPIVPGCPGRSAGENGLCTKLFGRPALLRPMSVDGTMYIALSYIGEVFDEPRLCSILTVLGLLFGQEVDVRAEVEIDDQGRAVRRRLWLPKEAREQDPRPAVSLADRTSVLALGSSLESMVEAARSLRFDEDSAIVVAVKYLLRWSGRQLDLEIRDITSALNVLIESAHFSPHCGHIVAPAEFSIIVEALKTAFCNVAIDIPATLRTRIDERIAEANQTSTNERRRRFWSEVGFELTDEEKRALKHRNTMAHKGYIDTEDAAEEYKLFLDIGRARTAVNEAILALLGYGGPIRDYLRGTRMMRDRRVPAALQSK